MLDWLTGRHFSAPLGLHGTAPNFAVRLSRIEDKGKVSAVERYITDCWRGRGAMGVCARYQCSVSGSCLLGEAMQGRVDSILMLANHVRDGHSVRR